MESHLMDMDELMEIMDNDKELVRECFDDFIVDSPEMLRKIKMAIDMKDREHLEKTAHAIKGSLRYLAAHNAADIAFKLEKMGAQAHSDVETAEDVYQSLANECKKLRNFMENYDV
ncbi:MAG: Hpt domain-containing protein [Proteobacteria bacterium]|nr:Hpt domain-containing protein [Pseudomonadota bacterium]